MHFDYRVPSAFDFNQVFGDDLGLDVASMGCDLGEAGEHVDLSQRPGGLQQSAGMFAYADPKSTEKLGFQRSCLLACTQNSRFMLLEFGRDVAFGVRGRLLANVVGGDTL